LSIGIIVYSRTGHTLSVARKLEEKLAADGHDVALEELETIGASDLGATTSPLQRRPSIGGHGALVFGSPVNGGRMSAPTRSYLDQIPSLHGKKVVLLLTHFFPRVWGANQTLQEMTETCESKGATICARGSVRWTSLRRRRRIASVVDDLAERLR
jgi:multimeric flavodoxin WrbA